MALIDDRRPAGRGVLLHIQLPPAPPDQILRVLATALGRYEEAAGHARARGYEPLLTLPDDLVDTRSDVVARIFEQAERARAAGEPLVTIELDVSSDVARLIRWYLARRHVLARVTSEVSLDDWSESIALLHHFLESAAKQIPSSWFA